MLSRSSWDVQPGGCVMVWKEIVLPAPPEEVWNALTRSEELSAWFEAEVDIDPRPRGIVTARASDGTIREGTVIAANAPFRLVIVWRDADRSRLEFTLQPVVDAAEWMSDIGATWDRRLENLRRRFR